MATFHYKAYGADGRVVEATLAAATVQDAHEAIYATGITPFAIRPVADAAGGEGGARSQAAIRLPAKVLAAFTFELASLSKAGMPLDEMMRIVGGAGAKPKVATLSRLLLKDLLNGAQLSEAMAKYPRTFSADYRAILAAGEASGVIARVLGDLSDLLARRVALRAKIVSALVYPAILVVMSLVSVLVIVSVLVPNLMPIFSDANLPLPGILGMLDTLERGAATEALSFGVVAVLALLAARWASGDAGAMLAVDRSIANLPYVGRLVRMHAAGRFARGLGTLVGAGVPMMTALRIGNDLVANRHLRGLYGLVIARVPQGDTLHRAFEDAALIPPASLRLIAVGEETGRLAGMLAEAATILENEMQNRVERALALTTPLLTICIGGGVGALIMSVMSAVLSINDLAFK